jgi:perosamine synthetase
MITTNDAQLAKLARRLRDHAFHPERHFWHEYVGFNYRMTNLQAAIGLAQTERIEVVIAARHQLRAWYNERLKSVSSLQLPTEGRRYRSVFWMYAIRTNPALQITMPESSIGVCGQMHPSRRKEVLLKERASGMMRTSGEPMPHR